jgi:hypothetical protein
MILMRMELHYTSRTCILSCFISIAYGVMVKDRISRVRTLMPHPHFAGTGGMNDAANFVCAN